MKEFTKLCITKKKINKFQGESSKKKIKCEDEAKGNINSSENRHQKILYSCKTWIIDLALGKSTSNTCVEQYDCVYMCVYVCMSMHECM